MLMENKANELSERFLNFAASVFKLRNKLLVAVHHKIRN